MSKLEGGSIVRYCEFTGDANHAWDEVGYKRTCEYAGFVKCLRHAQPLIIHRGWRVCCVQCTTPIQEAPQ